jgi:outer membrane usher protein
LKKNSTYLTSLILLLLVGLSSNLKAQSTDELFNKVFGKSSKEEKEITIDVSMGDFFIGEVKVWLVGEKIVRLSRSDLERVLIDKVRTEKMDPYRFGTGEISPEALPFKILYYPSELRVSFNIPQEELKPQDANVFDDLIPHYSRKASEPAPFSFGLNYKLEQVRTDKLPQESYFQAQTDAFMNIKKISFENQMNYLSNRREQWARQSTRMIYDRPNRMQRYEAGDVNYPIIGYQQAILLGGVSFYKDFSLNPYRMVTPTSSFEYQIDSRSLVRTYVNNILLKTEYMSPGRYSVRDIPLNNGINRINIEITDEFAATKTLVFNESGSLDLLAKGVSRYALASGYPSVEQDSSRNYEKQDGAFTSGFFQHGIDRQWTGSIYTQKNSKFSMLGSNHIFSTSYGNWSFDFTGTKNKFNTGYVTQGTYQLNLFGTYWYDSHTFTARIEHRSPWFSEIGDNFKNRFDWNATASYSVPLFEKFNVALGASYQNPALGDAARLGYNGSVTSKIFDSSSLTVFAGRSRDELKVWSNQLYFFFNMTFGNSSSFASAFYDRESKTKRLTVIRDTGKKYNDLKTSASIDENEVGRQGSVDLQYNTVLADIGARQEIITNRGSQEGYRTSVRLLSSFAFAHTGDDAGFSIGRPISNSFVIFKPNSDWKGQKFGVQTSSGINDTGTGLFGESLLSGLTPYQYRRLQLDPSNLEPGYILGQESFVVYPRKNSGHLFVIGKSGLLVIRGRIVDNKKQPVALRVGFWTSADGKSTPFFTGRDGEFLIEGIEPGIGSFQLDDEAFKPLMLDLAKEKRGLVEMGDLTLSSNENVL